MFQPGFSGSAGSLGVSDESEESGVSDVVPSEVVESVEVEVVVSVEEVVVSFAASAAEATVAQPKEALAHSARSKASSCFFLFFIRHFPVLNIKINPMLCNFIIAETYWEINENQWEIPGIFMNKI